MTQTNAPSGISTSMFLRLLCRRADDPQQLARRSARRLRGHLRSAASPDRYWPVRLRAALGDRRRRSPLATTSPPRTPGPGPKSTMWSAARIVSSSCSTTTTVLPRSRSCVERVEQPVVVARVQADRRLVEDVEHADQAAADLAGQADALRLAAGERRRRAVERQVFEADVDQEAEPAADFLEHFGRRSASALRRAPAR